MTHSSMSTLDAKEQFAELINRVVHHKERVVLTRRGKEIAVIIPFEDLKFLQAAQDKEDLGEAIDALTEARAQGTLTLDQIKEEMGN